MCGIIGMVNFPKGVYSNNVSIILYNMLKAINHRGPDDNGIWIDNDNNVALGHARLSIIDLTMAGHQPMSSFTERFVIVFNGEIYNYIELKEELTLKGVSFKSNSDTEVILGLLELYGVEKTLDFLVGMFALSVYDRKLKKLYLARDRTGEKPLYYGLFDNSFIFASELKAIKIHPNFKREINREALTQYLRYKYVPTGLSIYENIYKLEPGCLLSFDIQTGNYTKSQFWSVKSLIENNINSPFNYSLDDAISELDGMLKNVIKNQMISDVPLGAFLSGGIDSSLVVSIMQNISGAKNETFTIGFDDQEFNEAYYAKQIANYLGTNHNELYVSPTETMNVIPKLPTIYDEPFADSSQIPTYLLSKLAKSKVTVVLSGDGGDELFGGYSRHFLASKLSKIVNNTPHSVRGLISKGILGVKPSTWDRTFNISEKFSPQKYKLNNPGYKLHKLAGIINVNHPGELYRLLRSEWSTPTKVVNDGYESLLFFENEESRISGLSYSELFMYYDTISYLPDDILVKVDRASMANSLESRIPFLDHKLIEFAWRLPLSMKVNNNEGKYILKKLLEKYVPKKFFERPKMGFGVPIGNWLRGPLKDWSEELLDETRINNEGYFNTKEVRDKWDEHLSGKRNWENQLWIILMFQAWLENENKGE